MSEKIDFEGLRLMIENKQYCFREANKNRKELGLYDDDTDQYDFEMEVVFAVALLGVDFMKRNSMTILTMVEGYRNSRKPE